MNLEQAVTFIEEERDPDPSVTELAMLERAMKVVGESIDTLDETINTLDEFKALEDAREKYSSHPVVVEHDGLVEFLQKAREKFQDRANEYKAMQIEAFVETGENKYPGGGIQVRTSLEIFSDKHLVDWMIEHAFRDYLTVNQKLIKEHWNQPFIEFMQLEEIVAYVEKPVATLDKSLINYYPTED